MRQVQEWVVWLLPLFLVLDCHWGCTQPWHMRRWQHQWVAAKQALHGREAKLAEAAEGIERNLLLLGCTAIEDKLQAGVPECIERLALAGIRIWVLTGDKQVRSRQWPFHACQHGAATA